MLKLIIFILCELLIIVFLAFYVIVPFFGGPFYPSSLKKVKKFIKLADLKAEDKIIDLGSGDGRIVYQLAKNKLNVLGIELNPFLAIFSNLFLIITRKSKYGKVKIGSVFKVNLSNYNVVYCYLLPATMQKLKIKFEKELKPGTKVVTNTFQIKEWEPVAVDDKLYLYEIGVSNSKK